MNTANEFPVLDCDVTQPESQFFEYDPDTDILRNSTTGERIDRPYDFREIRDWIFDDLLELLSQHGYVEGRDHLIILGGSI